MAVTTAPARLAEAPPLFDPVNQGGSMPDRLRHVAARRPDHPALVDGQRTYTYRDLDDLSDRVGAGLLGAVPEPGARIPVLFASGAAPVVLALCGVLKAGGAYTALSPDFPLDRNRALWDDSDPCALLTDRQHAALALDITQDRRPVFILEELLEASAGAPPAPDIQPEQLATIFYTSGSTGRPKGITRTHGQFLLRAARAEQEYGVGPASRLIMSRFIGYAASGTVFSGLLNGATVFTLDLQRLSVSELIAFLQREAITSLSLPISVFRQVVDQAGGPLELPHLRRLGLPGEALLKSDAEAFQRIFPRTCMLTHGFATSEAGSATRFVVTHDTVISTPRVPAGRPLEGVEVLLWDDNGQPAPPGEPGEIVVRNPGMSDGYWRNPELTAKVFLPAPDGGGRLYRTGDLGRWLPDGNLLHLGRKDQMVKIRGYRIEPAEVELALQQVDARLQAAVVPREREPGELELVAFVVPGEGVEFSPVALRRGLARTLPPHMLPARFVRLEAWPLTTSDKIDRQALRRMELPPAEPSETYVEPADEQERRLAALWESVLKTAPIGRHDDFFELGGNSLAAIALMARVTRATGQTLPITALFQAPTVAQQAALLRGENQARKLPDAIVTFNPLGDRLPLFLLPELESSAMNLVKLIRHLGVERPIYGLQPRGFEDGQRPFDTIPENAAYYVDAIRQVRPDGPYHLAGICYGGIIAYEVARQLREQGERVAGLCLIDVPGVRPAGAGWLEQARRGLRGLRRRYTLWKTFTRERLPRALRRLRPSWANATSRRFYDEQGRLQPGRRVRYAQNLAGLRYRPLPFDGAASVIRSAEHADRGPLSGWPELLRDGVNVHVVPGTTHEDLLGQGAYLRQMAEWLNACLERADPPGRATGRA